ncbi:hypothetical protein [Cytobacillus oceanisediminis]|uniref:hypothetical protein n=1 Tax=Cytobacillus oceanisediminis TaxID=665099 RepID=UPI001C2431CD|nr:hypothetical protein [Cytobacillus oceanisediminis]MBU8732343.1 hypothetical protein [Cytobacillus oceanisediminis]MDK7666522.1 hypothetical protein [Cytobacillus oceanisediminis]
MGDKKIWIFILLASILMMIFPIITNGLMFVGDFKVAGDTKTWIGYLGSFWGAIIGGIVSGAITLMGVRLTIENQDRKEFIDLYPERKMILDSYITKIESTLKYLDEEAFGRNRKVINRGQVSKKIDGYRDYFYSNLKNITKVNGETYHEAKSIIEMLKLIDGSIRHDFFMDEEDDFSPIEGFHVTNKTNYNQGLNNIESSLKKLREINNKLDEKYNTLTGNV